MRHPLLFASILAVAALIGGMFWVFRTGAMAGTPEAGPNRDAATVLTVVEHNDHTATIDLGEAGSSVGDLRVWGPNPLYDESNATDTGTTTQGTCVALNADFACVLTETIVFPDGSTLEFQGVEQGGDRPSTRTIVGGSGQYLGASGTAAVTPSDDFTLWTRTIEIAPR